MGRTGVLIALTRRPDAASLSRLREVVLEWLGRQWDRLLGQEKAEEAWGWVSIGQDSMLTVGDYEIDQDAPVEEIEFGFYRDVHWPIHRAEHYLLAALVIGR